MDGKHLIENWSGILSAAFSSWKGNDITSWEGKCDSAHHMSHTDLKLLSFLADSSPDVSAVIYYLILFLVELTHLRNKKEKFREKERKKERKIFQNHVLQPLVLIGKMCFDQFSVRSFVGLETLELLSE
ncbi:hypothetical protein F2Q69_00007895 [Brassica cretica]|uniref:Uncharacterized protein n=1 Tax=Brassica cretica TaxID=69181 RepID=A0A8S9PGU5_BRACR|nr:hypothetical protein F2Q69_00007895 [Brassica cretica]